jgi:uncharacterized RDD family membrane protein YckC
MTYTATMNEPLPAGATGYAGFWRRFLAYLIDSAILFTVLSLLGRTDGPIAWIRIGSSMQHANVRPRRQRMGGLRIGT